MGEAARLVDVLAHRHAGGRWLATGGGGYDAYRVVPRTWSQVWLAGAHREVPSATPLAWRERWATEAARYGQAPLPERFDDAPNAGLPVDGGQEAAEARSRSTAGLVRRLVVPRLLREARDRGWWDPLAGPTPPDATSASDAEGAPAIVASMDAQSWEQVRSAAGVLPPADPASAHDLVAAGLADGLRVTAAIAGMTVIGAAVSRTNDDATRADLLGLGVAPAWRRRGLATRLLATHLEDIGASGRDLEAEVTVAERDPIEPLDRAIRAEVARRLLADAGFGVEPASFEILGADPAAIVARWTPGRNPR
jgi:ribosomal protein S18 acetylase RimI-like enzyme